MLAPSEFDGLMAHANPFEHKPTVAVAVSGGIDSMALLLLAHSWAKRHHGTVIALTVDHGLRSESAAEAKQVQQWCKAYGIEHHILTWAPPALPSSIQAQARQARYQLLTGWCHEHHVLHLLTAHHRDDQVETLFFRLARSSGLDGLACMPVLAAFNGVRLVRPLLNISKARLQATLATFSQPWAEDPTNRKRHYTRNHIRHLLQSQEQYASLAARATTVSQQLGKFRNLLENNLAKWLTYCFEVYPEGYGKLDLEAFLALPQEVALRVLSAIAMTIGGEQYQPRSEKLARFYDGLKAKPQMRRRTFSGLLFIHQPTSGQLLVCREPKAMEGETAVAAGATLLWDRRYHIVRKKEFDNIPVHVKGLGKDIDRLGDLPEASNPLLHKSVLATLPSFWYIERLVAVPHIHYVDPDYGDLCSALFQPAKPLAGTAFFSMNICYET